MLYPLSYRGSLTSKQICVQICIIYIQVNGIAMIVANYHINPIISPWGIVLYKGGGGGVRYLRPKV